VTVKPAAHQVEFSPFLYTKALLAHCRRHDIQVTAYSPLTQGKRLDHSMLVALAARLGRTPAQVLIRWALEHGLLVIPKSASRKRIAENGRVFDFSLS